MLTTTFVILRHGHHVRVAELLAERRHDVAAVALFQAVHLSTTPLHLRQIRTRVPSSSRLRPTRVGAPHSGQTSCTFDACSGASRSTMPPLTFFCGFGARVALDEVHAFDDDAALVGHHAQHAAALAAIAAGDDDARCRSSGSAMTAAASTHSTSGASEMIFMNRRSRSSRATGPNTRVPIGSPSSLMSTAAFRSNRM